MFGEYPHQLTVGLRFHRAGTNIHATRPKINEFVRDLAKQYKTQVAGFAVVNGHKHPHCHLLLFAKTGSIADVTTHEVEALWRYGSAKARPYEDEGADIYAALNITPNRPDLYNVFDFNRRLLKKARQLTN